MNRMIALGVLLMGASAWAAVDTAPTAVPAAAASPAAPVAIASDLDGWEQFDQFGVITMYRKQLPGSDVLGYRGEGMVHATIGKLVTAIRDVARQKEWIDRLAEASVLFESADGLSRREYVHASTPWPLRDREFVYGSTVTLDPKTKTIQFEIRSTEDSAKPENSKRVRAVIVSGRFVLKAESPTSDTYVIAEIHADPMGSIPKWLVNMVQKNWPKRTFGGLMKQVAKADVLEHPLAAQLFAKPFATPPAKP